MRIKVLVFILAIPVILSGQYSQLIDTVVVSAYRAPLKVSQTGRSISIINAKEIESYNATSVDEILQLAAGIEVQSRGGFGTQADILMRGSTFTQVLILVDGMRINDPLTGHFNGNIPVATEEIERIEILRGASSAIFGPDAVGGVINIITKLHSTHDDDQSISGSIGFGQHNLRDMNVGFVQTSGDVKVTGGISIRQSDGEEIQPISLIPDTELESYRSFFDIKTAGIGLSYRLSPTWQLSARTSFDLRDFDARYYYTTSTFDKSVETVNNVFNHVMLRQVGDRISTQIDVSHKHTTDEFVFSPDFPSTNNHTTKFTNVMISQFRSIGDTDGLKTGIQLDARSISSNDRGDHNDQHVGVFVSYLLNRGAWHIIPNMRIDHDTNYGTEWLPSVNLSYNVDDLTLRATAGKSIRAADYTERFVSNNLMDLTPGRSLGNPNLLSERSWSAEVGADYDVSSSWSISGTVYRRWSTNLIDYISTNESIIGSVSDIGSLRTGENYFFASNIADVRTSGMEIESSVSIPTGSYGRFQLVNSLSLIDQSSSQDIISVYLANSAKVLITNRLSFYTKAFNFHLSGLYKERNGRISEAIGASLEDSYLLMNASVLYNLSDQIQLGLQVINLSDTDYQNILGAPMPGRWLRGSFSWSF